MNYSVSCSSNSNKVTVFYLMKSVIRHLISSSAIQRLLFFLLIMSITRHPISCPVISNKQFCQYVYNQSSNPKLLDTDGKRWSNWGLEKVYGLANDAAIEKAFVDYKESHRRFKSFLGVYLFYQPLLHRQCTFIDSFNCKHFSY